MKTLYFLISLFWLGTLGVWFFGLSVWVGLIYIAILIAIFANTIYKNKQRDRQNARKAMAIAAGEDSPEKLHITLSNDENTSASTDTVETKSETNYLWDDDDDDDDDNENWDLFGNSDKDEYDFGDDYDYDDDDDDDDEEEDFDESKFDNKSHLVKLTYEHFITIRDCVCRLKDYCREISQNEILRQGYNKKFIEVQGKESRDADEMCADLIFLAVKDLFACFEHLGCPINVIASPNPPIRIDLELPEGQALYATTMSLSDEEKTDYAKFKANMALSDNIVDRRFTMLIRRIIFNMFSTYYNCDCRVKATGPVEFNIPLLVEALAKPANTGRYLKIMYDFSLVLAQSDRNITRQEQQWLDHLAESYEDETPGETSSLQKHNNNGNAAEANKDYRAELDTLIGLKQVKKEIQGLADFIAINAQRSKAGFRVAPMSYHCVFAGNPGTGKTTVARILAGIYKQLGILQDGQLVETDRSGLVAEYVGQTAVKTNKIIDKAIGGVLFIDEAYTLAQGGQGDYGKEAIATLLKRMEDDREHLVVILAGYNDEIEQFINLNPGLRSRFNRYIHFEDYTQDELKQIFMYQAGQYDYRLSDDAQKALDTLLSERLSRREKDFGNARYVRNLFEKVISHQAKRLSRDGVKDQDSLAILRAEDMYE